MSDTKPSPVLLANDLVRFVLEVAAIVIYAAWGFLSWPMPWNIVFGIGGPVLAILIWALFVSPKAVLRTDLFVRTIVEVILFAAAALALWDLGWGVPALVFAILATVTGFINGWRSTR